MSKHLSQSLLFYHNNGAFGREEIQAFKRKVKTNHKMNAIFWKVGYCKSILKYQLNCREPVRPMCTLFTLSIV